VFLDVIGSATLTLRATNQHVSTAL